jgi:hypothetical protein
MRVFYGIYLLWRLSILYIGRKLLWRFHYDTNVKDRVIDERIELNLRIWWISGEYFWNYIMNFYCNLLKRQDDIALSILSVFRWFVYILYTDTPVEHVTRSRLCNRIELSIALLILLNFKRFCCCCWMLKP